MFGGRNLIALRGNNSTMELGSEILIEAIDANGEYVYVTSRGNHYLYQFQAVNGALIDSSPLGAESQIVSPGGISVMQNICINCE